MPVCIVETDPLLTWQLFRESDRLAQAITGLLFDSTQLDSCPAAAPCYDLTAKGMENVTVQTGDTMAQPLFPDADLLVDIINPVGTWLDEADIDVAFQLHRLQRPRDPVDILLPVRLQTNGSAGHGHLPAQYLRASRSPLYL